MSPLRASTLFMLLGLAILAISVLADAVAHGHVHRQAADKAFFGAPSDVDIDLVDPFQGTVTPCVGSTKDCVPAILGSLDRCPPGDQNAWASFADSLGYDIICDIDFPSEHNIYPFVPADTFEACLTQCHSYNARLELDDVDRRCLGLVFAPERRDTGDNCYLKSDLSEPLPATLSLVGATKRAGLPTEARSTAAPAETMTRTTAPAATLPSVKRPIPKVRRSQLHGPSINKPTSQWVYHEPASPMKLTSDLLVPGINSDLISEFEIAGDTGPLKSDLSLFPDQLAYLSVVPRLSRDGGKGGEFGGYHIFYFCDTASFATSHETQQIEMVSMTSSSVAVDEGMHGRDDQPLVLVDGIGQWNDDVGRMRGFAPMTAGEHSFNIALAGEGYRYVVWPESSLIPLNHTHAIQYASLVYDDVNMDSQPTKFTSLGNTLLTISVDQKYGPTAERTVRQLYHQGEVAWGSVGGIRSWGPQGVGGTDGKVYVFGKTAQGILVGRVDAGFVADRDAYEYWMGDGWTSDQLPPDATSFLVEAPIMDFDLFYSPYHKTFIMVYLTSYVDDTFYYRYLQAPEPIEPPTFTSDANVNTSFFLRDRTIHEKDGQHQDQVESILHHTWSPEQILYEASNPGPRKRSSSSSSLSSSSSPSLPPPRRLKSRTNEYIYAGCVHRGYYGEGEDITKGGRKMLLSWTRDTGVDPADVVTGGGYEHVTAHVEME